MEKSLKKQEICSKILQKARFSNFAPKRWSTDISILKESYHFQAELVSFQAELVQSKQVKNIYQYGQ